MITSAFGVEHAQISKAAGTLARVRGQRDGVAGLAHIHQTKTRLMTGQLAGPRRVVHKDVFGIERVDKGLFGAVKGGAGSFEKLTAAIGEHAPHIMGAATEHINAVHGALKPLAEAVGGLKATASTLAPKVTQAASSVADAAAPAASGLGAKIKANKAPIAAGAVAGAVGAKTFGNRKQNS